MSAPIRSQQASSSRHQTINFPTDPAVPRQCLTTDHAVSQWLASPGFKGFWGWIQRRCERIKGKQVMRGSHAESHQSIRCLMDMLERMTLWMEQVPPQPQSNQRFGNLAFRSYIKIVEERLPALISDWDLPPALQSQLLPLWIDSNAFGHPTRLDYGTGHELAYVLGLWCCVVSGWIGSSVSGNNTTTVNDNDNGIDRSADAEGVEDELILRVFTRYLELTTLLQKTYKLEPAGSHGVWGLDDYCFLPYLFGSAQLLDSDLTPSAALSLAQSSSDLNDLYTLSLHHLTLFKSGAAFSEHSPLLYSLSQMPSWTKPHGGLKKMFLGEVVGKRVVVQGLFVGGWVWGQDVPGAPGAPSDGSEGRKGGVTHTDEGKGERLGAGAGAGAITKAPWAR